MTDKRTLIIESVLKLAKQGVDVTEATIQNIADEAGIGKGTIYEYFSSKDEIREAVILHVMDHMFGLYIQDIYDDLSFEEGLMTFIEQTFIAGKSMMAFTSFNQFNINRKTDIVKIRDILQRKLKEFTKAFEDLFITKVLQKGIDEGLVTIVIPSITLSILVKTIGHIAIDICHTEGDSDSYKRELYDLIYRECTRNQ